MPLAFLSNPINDSQQESVMMSPRYILLIGLVAISCVALPRFWGPPRGCDAIPGAKQDIVHREISMGEFEIPLDINGSSIHLRGVAPVAIEVPVYMHVVSASPDTVTDNTLKRQLEALNDDYAPSGIHFNMKGFTRTQDSSWARHEDKLALHRSLRVGDYSTLNLFYIDTFHHNPNNLATTTYPNHYAPSSDDFYLDGCTLHRGTLPGGDFAPYNLGRTTTHEVGHWLGLYHTFEGGACEGEGDFVGDTPVQAVAATKGCPPMRQDSCPEAPGWDDVTNFMDYGDDACMDGFTEGQARRMHSLWERFRAGK